MEVGKLTQCTGQHNRQKRKYWVCLTRRSKTFVGAILFFPTESSYHCGSDSTVWALLHSSSQLVGRYQGSAEMSALTSTLVHTGTLVSLNIQTGTWLESDTCFWHVKVPSRWRLGRTAAGKKTWCTCMLYSDLELGTHPRKREMFLSQVSRKLYLEMTINRKKRPTGKLGIGPEWSAVRVKESAFSSPQE